MTAIRRIRDVLSLEGVRGRRKHDDFTVQVRPRQEIAQCDNSIASQA